MASIDLQFKSPWEVTHIVCGDGFVPPYDKGDNLRFFVHTHTRQGKWGYPIRNTYRHAHNRADYVMFVDDDNILLPGALHKLAQRASLNKPDIIFSNMLQVTEKCQRVFPIGGVRRIKKSNVGTLNYCVSASLAEQCSFGLDYEGDWAFIEQCMKRTNKIEYIDEILSVWCSEGL